jgi:hypothetical protein
MLTSYRGPVLDWLGSRIGREGQWPPLISWRRSRDVNGVYKFDSGTIWLGLIAGSIGLLLFVGFGIAAAKDGSKLAILCLVVSVLLVGFLMHIGRFSGRCLRSGTPFNTGMTSRQSVLRPPADTGKPYGICQVGDSRPGELMLVGLTLTFRLSLIVSSSENRRSKLQIPESGTVLGYPLAGSLPCLLDFS